MNVLVRTGYLFLALASFNAAQAASILYSNSKGVNQSLSQFDQIYSGNNTDSALQVTFEGSHIGFQFGLDAGKGAQVLLDGNLVLTDSSDIWWEYDWNHPDVITSLFSGLSSGLHVLTVLWGENCCDGYNSGRFSTDGGKTWQMLSVQGLDSVVVPIPAALWLFGSGVVSMLGMRRRLLTKIS